MRAKRYGTGTGKTVRDLHGQNSTGPVRAKRYGTGTDKTVRAHTGYGAGAVRGTVWARYVARAFPRVQPVQATYRALMGARTACCWDCPYHARTGMFTGTLPINCFFRCSVHHINGNRTIKYTHHLQNQKNWHLDKTRTIFSIVKPGTQTRHTYTFRIKGSRCCCYNQHQHHCHNHQLTAVSFVGSVATVIIAVTH